MSAQHSPGPWRVRLGSKGQPVGIDAPAEMHIPGAVGGIVRQNGIGLPSSRTALANAHLIAASPDLLEALRILMAATQFINFDRDRHTQFAEARDLASAAIAKAEGRV